MYVFLGIEPRNLAFDLSKPKRILLWTGLTFRWHLVSFCSIHLSPLKVPPLLPLGSPTQMTRSLRSATNKSMRPAETKLQF